MASVAPCSVTAVISGENILCPDQTDLHALPENNNLSYLWNTGQTSRIITVNSPGTYYVTVSANQNCFSTASKVIGVSRNIVIEEDSIMICKNSSRTVSAIVLPSGNYNIPIWKVAQVGTNNWQTVADNVPQGISYTGINSLNLGINSLNNTLLGLYKYKIEGYIFCGQESSYFAQDSIIINFQNCDCSPSVSPYLVECPEGPFTLTASEGSGYSWGHGPTTRQILLDPPNQTTNYTVTVTCDNGGTGTATAVVNMDGCNGEPHAIIETVQCIPGTTLYEVLGTVYIPEPDGNQVIIHDVEGNVVTTVPTNTNTTEYSFTLDDLTPDNQYHYVQFSEGGFENYEKFYFAPAQCLNIHMMSLLPQPLVYNQTMNMISVSHFLC
jgi:hypothetical protein